MLDLYNPIITGPSPFMMPKAIFMLQTSEPASSSHEVVGRFGERHVSDCTRCELSKCDFVVLDDVGMTATVHITCWGWGVPALSDPNSNVH